VEQKSFIPFLIQVPEPFRGAEDINACSKGKKCCKKWKKKSRCKKCPQK
jgi:hypothetical protein